MKWDTIKDRCVKESHTKILGRDSWSISTGFLSVAAILDPTYVNKYEGTLSDSLRKEFYKEVEARIDRWDVRCWKTLRDVFPNAFPKTASTIELTDNGWELN